MTEKLINANGHLFYVAVQVRCVLPIDGTVSLSKVPAGSIHSMCDMCALILTPCRGHACRESETSWQDSASAQVLSEGRLAFGGLLALTFTKTCNHPNIHHCCRQDNESSFGFDVVTNSSRTPRKPALNGQLCAALAMRSHQPCMCTRALACCI
eukprot:5266750-Amphidinium_carterae.1